MQDALSDKSITTSEFSKIAFSILSSNSPSPIRTTQLPVHEKTTSENTSLLITPSELETFSQVPTSLRAISTNEQSISSTTAKVSLGAMERSNSPSQEYTAIQEFIAISSNPSSHLPQEYTQTSVVLHSGNKGGDTAPSYRPNAVPTVSVLHTNITSPLQSSTITSIHPSPAQFMSSVLPTKNLTSSVITVTPLPFPGGLPMTGSTGSSSPPFSELSFTSVSSRTESTSSDSVTHFINSTLMSTLARDNNTTGHTKPTSTFQNQTTHVATFLATINSYATATPPFTTLPTTTASTVITSRGESVTTTTPTPAKIETTVVTTNKSTWPAFTKSSTSFPATITPALTTVTASVKTTSLPVTPVANRTALLTTTLASTTLKSTPLECQLSENLLVKTVLVMTQNQMKICDQFKQNITNGLSQALQKAFNSRVQVEANSCTEIVDSQQGSSLVTFGYYVSVNSKTGRLMYIASAVAEVLNAYGINSVMEHIRQRMPDLQYITLLAAPWNLQPTFWFQLKTVLQFVGSTENIHLCNFVQTMEQNLQKAFQYAENIFLGTNSSLTVQILNTSVVSQAVTLIYAVRNQSTFLNGTVSSKLLNHLSADLVGFYLSKPPLIIAESLDYPNIETSSATRNYWLITVIQGVARNLLGINRQNFARLMEERLAQLFIISHRQERRFKRATTVGSYTVQMVKMQHISGPKDPVELTYYALYDGNPLSGTSAAKQLSTIDSQRMALTLGYVVQMQADAVVKNPSNNLWVIAAVLAPITVVTVIIIIITAVLCRKNKNDFKPEPMTNMPPRVKPVQGFDYAKHHLGEQGADNEVLPITQETVVLPFPVSQDREMIQDESTVKTVKSTGTEKSQLSCGNGSLNSNEVGKPNPGKNSPQKSRKDGARKSNGIISDEEERSTLFDNGAKITTGPPDTSSGSVQLIAIKPVTLPLANPAPEESAIINGEVNKALKQKSDIEHYRNKLRLKAKRKGYYDFPQIDGNKSLTERTKQIYEKTQREIDSVLNPDTDGSSKNRQPQTSSSVYRSRQSLNSPSPGETEMDLLVTRERPRRGIRNSGYDTEPEIIEETNIDQVKDLRGYAKSRQVKGHSETSTLSSQPSIDEVRQQMHVLLEEAFSLASTGHGGHKRQQERFIPTQQLPYAEVVTSAPGTMSRPRGGVQWVPTYGPEMYQYSFPRPAYRFSQLPEMVLGSAPPPVPPRTGPMAVASLRRSTADVGSKSRTAECRAPEQGPHDTAAFSPVSRASVPVASLDHSSSNCSGNTVPAVFAIPANRPGFTGYFIPTPPTSYRNQAWMPYTGDSELPGQWADSVPLPGYIEAYPRPSYPQNSPSRPSCQYKQPGSMHPNLEQTAGSTMAASQQSLADGDTPESSHTNLSTAALVKAIREEVAKLAKKQTDMFEFQV
ncbi:UPF0606 protein KIAA1549L homolog [Microcaecilia unicolor]|uniref:UPF0606 protein KIAA1549L homolog n=1 Tax=Microcaecilia unicolor TaxID=1415580 RepID=A0A6P7XZI3_9AMPH|nr:UPF0606 protein KIAA1549L homolog [Microcaecilia unicolor]